MKEESSIDVISQVECLEGVLLAMGTSSDKKFDKKAKAIIGGLAELGTFEEAQRLLGELLGFTAGKGKGDAAPDSWWLGNSKGLVFEDHAKGDASTVFGANKAKQVAGHPAWLGEYCPEARDLMKVTAVLVTPCTMAGRGAKPALMDVRYWELKEFVAWAKKAVNVVRTLKGRLSQEGDLYWRQEAEEELVDAGLTLDSILGMLPVAADAMTIQVK